jgi:integrase
VAGPHDRNLALRQQLSTVLQKRRPRIGLADRAFWVVLRRVWANWVRCGRDREARDGDRVAPRGLRPLLEVAAIIHTDRELASHRGVTLKAVQELLGHATMDMTMRYPHLSPDVKRDAIQVLDRRPEPASDANSHA